MLRKRRPPLTLEVEPAPATLPEQSSSAAGAGDGAQGSQGGGAAAAQSGPTPLSPEAAARFEASPRLKTLIMACWQQEKTRRPRAQVVLKTLEMLLQEQQQREQQQQASKPT